MAADLVQLVNLLAAGVLTGNELGTWAVVHPAFRRLAFSEEVRAEQEVTRRYGLFMPGLMMVTVGSGFVAAGLADDEQALLLAGTAAYAAMLAMTLLGNVPINVRTLRFSADDSPSAGGRCGGGGTVFTRSAWCSMPPAWC